MLLGRDRVVVAGLPVLFDAVSVSPDSILNGVNATNAEKSEAYHITSSPFSNLSFTAGIPSIQDVCLLLQSNAYLCLNPFEGREFSSESLLAETDFVAVASACFFVSAL